MVRKVLKSLFILTVLLITLNSKSIVASAALTDGNYEYEYINDGKEVKITKYLGSEEYVYLPNTIKGKKVTTLGSYAFSGNETIIEVEFNSNLKKIEYAVFYNCDRLEQVVIPKNVKYIEGGMYSTGAFENCDNLTTVTIGSGLEYIDYSTFENCKSLESVTIGSGVKYINPDAFAYCNNLKTVKFGSGLETINESAFYNCTSLSSLTLPTNLELIGSYAFYNCQNLKTINFNSKLKSIGYGAFYNADKLQSLVIPNNVKEIKGGEYNTGAFENCDNLKTVTIGDGLEYIGYSIFEYCKSLESVTIGDGVKYIDPDAFENCSSLETVKFGSGLEKINESAFYNCTSLSSITFPSNLKEIGSYAFYNCNNLKTISFNNKLESIGYGAFYNADQLQTLVIPDSVKEIKGGEYNTGSFENCDNLATVTIGDGLEYIGYSVFEDCKSLESVTIGDGVKYINPDAFLDCYNLKTVKFGSGLEKINESAFYNCTSLSSITFPSNLKEIEPYAFYNCNKLKTINFNGSLEKIGYGAFYNADQLQTLVIPDSVKYIEGGMYSTGAFEGCDNLRTVSIGENMESISYSAFEYCKSLEKVYFLGNAPSINSTAFYNTNSNLRLYYKSGATGFGSLDYNKSTFNPSNTHVIVTFKPNYSGGSDLEMTTLKGATVGVPAGYNRRGYSLAAWYSSQDTSGSSWDFDNNIINSNRSLYAKWTRNKYTLTFDARGGKTSTSKKTVLYNSTVGTLPTPTRNGYVFKGWYPGQDGSGTKYTSSSKMPARNMTLYAKWSKLGVPTAKAASASYSSNKVTWKAISGADGYEVYRATSKSGTYSLRKTTISLSYTNTSLTTGKTYYYKVRAYKNVNGKKVYSFYSSVVSSKPKLTKPSVTLSAGTRKAYVKWKKISGANGYEVYRATSKSGTYSKVKTVTSGSTVSYTNSSLTKNKGYYYKVRAYRTVNGKKVYSSYSSVKYIKVK